MKNNLEQLKTSLAQKDIELSDIKLKNNRYTDEINKLKERIRKLENRLEEEKNKTDKNENTELKQKLSLIEGIIN